MLGAVSRVFRPGVKFDYIICVVGDQGAGKSSFFRLLAVEDEWFTDDLKDLESNKVYEKLQGHWIIELSEMLRTAFTKVGKKRKAKFDSVAANEIVSQVTRSFLEKHFKK